MLRSSLRTLTRSSRNWLGLPLLFVTACGGSTIADSTWVRTGLPDRVLPPPPWYQAWATEQAKLNPDPEQLATARAERLLWEAQRAGGSAEVLIAESDEATLAKVGQMALDTVGYDEIMRLAEQKGWVKWVPNKHALSATSKQFLADGPPLPNVQEIVKESLKLVMTKTAPVAVVVSQLDTPAPGPGDLLAVGIFAVSLVAAGGISVYIYVKNQDSPGPTSQPQSPPAPQPAPRKYPNQTCENDEMARLEKEMHTLCDGGFAATCGGSSKKIQENLQVIPCSAIKLSIQQRQACVAARWDVQNKCFGGKPDDVHKKAIDNHQRGLDYCEALKLINCAKGHAMAGK